MVTLSETAINEYRAFRPYDQELEMLLRFQLGFDDEKTGNSIGLTLVVNGSVISGTAVTHEDWTQKRVTDLRAQSTDGTDRLVEIIETIASGKAEMKANNKTENESKEAGRYPNGRQAINLTNATVRDGNSIMNFKSMRVLMDSVDAWSIEILATPTN